jgi:hypothetical protein
MVENYGELWLFEEHLQPDQNPKEVGCVCWSGAPAGCSPSAATEGKSSALGLHEAVRAGRVVGNALIGPDARGRV